VPGCRPDPLGETPNPLFFREIKGVRGIAPGGFGRQPNYPYFQLSSNTQAGAPIAAQATSRARIFGLTNSEKIR